MNTGIQTLAQQYVANINPEGVVPFPFEKLLQLHPDVAVIVIDFPEDILGSLALNETKTGFTLYLRRDLAKERQDVALALLMAHVILHREVLLRGENLVLSARDIDGQAQLVCSRGIAPNCEEEALAFAFELLMPEVITKKAWVTLSSIQGLAGVFKLPVPFVTQRLSALGIFS